MAKKSELTCCSCHMLYPREQIILYGSQKNPLKYCPKCYEDRVSRDKFYQYVKELFGLITPGPKIYSQRKKLMTKYGYTDETIIQTLKYLFEIKNLDRDYESIGLVNPENVEEAKKYFKKKAEEEEAARKAARARIEKIVAPTQKSERDLGLIKDDDLGLDELEG